MNLDAQVEFQQVGALLDGTLVGTVNGELVRRLVNVDWIGGGHGYAYRGKEPTAPNKAIPLDRIWLERMPEAATGIIAVHELVEYCLMRYAGWEYERAHHFANSCEAVERALRAGRPVGENILEAAVARWAPALAPAPWAGQGGTP